jgi:hypothetical protein
MEFQVRLESQKPLILNLKHTKNDRAVATSDGIVIDSVSQVIDIPAYLMEKMEIEPIRLY